jgi:hypothetical protein
MLRDHRAVIAIDIRRVVQLVVTLALSSSCHAGPAETPPACSDAARHALDFWLGEWTVRSGDEVVATSRIERSPLGCAIVESYRQNDGFSGTSLSFYDAALKRWRQTWVDSTGAVGEFVGEASRDSVQFTGETHRADGTRIHRRMGLVAEDGGARQTSWAFTRPHCVATALRARVFAPLRTGPIGNRRSPAP